MVTDGNMRRHAGHEVGKHVAQRLECHIHIQHRLQLLAQVHSQREGQAEHGNVVVIVRAGRREAHQREEALHRRVGGKRGIQRVEQLGVVEAILLYLSRSLVVLH